jgi:hypothetical protein
MDQRTLPTITAQRSALKVQIVSHHRRRDRRHRDHLVVQPQLEDNAAAAQPSSTTSRAGSRRTKCGTLAEDRIYQSDLCPRALPRRPWTF